MEIRDFSGIYMYPLPLTDFQSNTENTNKHFKKCSATFLVQVKTEVSFLLISFSDTGLNVYFIFTLCWSFRRKVTVGHGHSVTENVSSIWSTEVTRCSKASNTGIVFWQAIKTDRCISFTLTISVFQIHESCSWYTQSCSPEKIDLKRDISRYPNSASYYIKKESTTSSS